MHMLSFKTTSRRIVFPLQTGVLLCLTGIYNVFLSSINLFCLVGVLISQRLVIRVVGLCDLREFTGRGQSDPQDGYTEEKSAASFVRGRPRDS
jgi:hypothetical protein